MLDARYPGRIKLLFILLICALPVAAAYFAFHSWRPQQGTVNYGELLQPRPLPDPALQSVDGRAFRMSDLRGKWVLLQVDSGSCDQNCRQKLYYLRQIRLTQGKDMQRIERVWIINDNGTPSQGLMKEYAGTWAVRDSGGELLTGLPAGNSVRDYIYVVDPKGNLMLRFPSDADPRKMVKDIARLLMVSQIG
ncbi:MAG TPA: cytochrome C oxidase subunit I [Burkholderiales bacterium]|nr:cytochrome C oxidase subunit I [Burkholderiales bacterium]